MVVVVGGLKPLSAGILISTEKFRDTETTHRKIGVVVTEAEMAVIHLQAKECQGGPQLPAARTDEEGPPLEPAAGARPLIWDFWPPDPSEKTSLLSSDTQFVVTCYGSPRQANGATELNIKRCWGPPSPKGLPGGKTSTEDSRVGGWRGTETW